MSRPRGRKAPKKRKKQPRRTGIEQQPEQTGAAQPEAEQTGAAQPPSSRLAEHVLDKKTRTLKPPMLNLGPEMVPVEWEPDLLPEMLWLASLMVENWPDRGEHHRALDALDEFVPADGPCLDGTVSAFSLVPDEHRAEARARLTAAGGLRPDFCQRTGPLPGLPRELAPRRLARGKDPGP